MKEFVRISHYLDFWMQRAFFVFKKNANIFENRTNSYDFVKNRKFLIFFKKLVKIEKI